MLTRSTTSTMTFRNVFTLGDNPQEFPPGTYEILVEEELLQSLSFEAYRHTATFLIIQGKGKNVGQTTMHKSTKEDLEHAIARDRALSKTIKHSDAALSPLEDIP